MRKLTMNMLKDSIYLNYSGVNPQIPVAGGARIQYKYIVTDAGGGLQWEDGEDRSCDVPALTHDGRFFIDDNLAHALPGGGVTRGQREGDDEGEYASDDVQGEADRDRECTWSSSVAEVRGKLCVGSICVRAFYAEHILYRTHSKLCVDSICVRTR
jgi:hypothetical protein